MYFLKGRNRAGLRKDARTLMRYAQTEIALAHPDMHAIAYDMVRNVIMPEVYESARIEKVPMDVVKEPANLFARALASHAYEQELLKALRGYAKDRQALAMLGTKKEYVEQAMNESRRRLALARKGEEMHARALALLPKTVKQRYKYEKRFRARLSKGREAMKEYDSSLSDFYAKAARARRKRELQ